MPPPASSTSWRPTTAASWPTASASGKTFTALAVIKYYELRNRSVLVLCPKKLADNWLNYNRNLKTNIFAKDRFNYDVLCHTDLSPHRGESFGTPLNRVNWGNYDLVVIDESHNFRNNDCLQGPGDPLPEADEQGHPRGREDQGADAVGDPGQQPLQRPAQPARLAYEGDSEKLAQEAAHRTSDRGDLPPSPGGLQRLVASCRRRSAPPRDPEALDFDFFELLDSVTIARSRKHIETFYDTKDIGKFPERRKPLSFHCPLTHRADVIGLQRDLRAALAAEARRLRPDQLHPAQPPREVRGAVRHRGRRRQRGKLGRVDRERACRR